MADTVWLQRPSGEVPWGFRLTGGSDQQQPLAVQRVTAGSIAATGLNKGDVVCGIGDRDTSSLTNAQANELIKQSGNLLQLHIAGSNRSPGAPPPMQQQQPTRLAQQLSDMSVGDGSYPFKNVPPSPASSAPGGPGYGAPSYVGGSNQSPSSPSKPTATSPVSPGQAPAMPDKVLNMAAKGPPEKKPWSYAPDTDSIRNQRDKVRRKQPSTNLPHYQHMLNMPDFNDPPQVVSPQGPPPGSQTPQAPEDQVGSDGVYVHAQYNSPLQMYSNDNVDEAFSGQTGGKVSGGKAAGPGNTPNKDIVMSPTYRLIHGLDAEKPKPKVMLPPEAARVDNNSLGVDDIGNYDETSIRYRGKNIPSKSFRMLQNMTGGPVENLPAEAQTTAPPQPEPAPARAPVPAPAPAQVPAPTPAPAPAAVQVPVQPAAPAPPPAPPAGNVAVQVVNNPDQGGRRRRRQPEVQQQQQEPADHGDRPQLADFDEKAYLSGKVKIVSGSVNNPQEVDYESYKQKQKERAPWEKTDEEKEAQYNEQAFLKGQIPILNDEPRYRQPDTNTASSTSPDDEPEDEKHFDEQAFLRGKVSMLGGEPKEHPAKGASVKEQAPWETRRKAEEEEEADRLRAQYDENAFLSGKIPLVRGDSQDGSALAPVTYTRPKPKKKEIEQGRPIMEDFDEQAFLQGKIDILGSEPNPALPPRGPRQKPSRERAPWERVPQAGDDEAEGVVVEERPRVPMLRQSVDRDATPENGKRYRQRAPWEKAGGAGEYDPDSACSSDAEFDESAFLKGRVPNSVRRTSQDSDSSSTGGAKRFTVLRRSMSRDRSPSRESDSGYNSLHPGEENQDPDKVIKKMTYKGGAIPSKAFMRLQRMTSRGAPPTAEELRAEKLRASSKDNLDVDEAIEKMNIQSNEPEQYMEKLKKTMEQQDVKIEPEPEVTDF